MTQDEIIEMAQKAKIYCYDGHIEGTESNLKRFADLVTFAEREACANTARLALQHIHKVGEIAESAIRARGQE
jgi:hypothetical protein